MTYVKLECDHAASIQEVVEFPPPRGWQVMCFKCMAWRSLTEATKRVLFGKEAA